jgi:leucyl/phenylalanyl-tRNA--protein transferase
MFVPVLSRYSHTFPDPNSASKEGIVAYGGDLSINRIMQGYSKGIFPWFNEEDPILWWSPDPRFVLQLDEFKISKSLAKTIKKNIFEVRFDTNFEQVIKGCAKAKRDDQEGTWITNDMIEAYCDLHQAGFAHSFESYYEGELVGGGYGVVIGDIFCGESMFALKSDASKVALVKLVEHLKKQSFRLIDSQVYTPHLERFGAKQIPRTQYLEYVKKALYNPKEF